MQRTFTDAAAGADTAQQSTNSGAALRRQCSNTGAFVALRARVDAPIAVCARVCCGKKGD